MNIHVNDEISRIRDKFPEIEFELGNEILYQSPQYNIDIQNIEHTLYSLDLAFKTAESKRKVILYTRHIILTQKQYRDMKQDANHIHIFLSGVFLENINYKKSAIGAPDKDTMWLHPASDEGVFTRTYGAYCYEADWKIIGYAAPNIISILITNKKISVFNETTNDALLQCLLDLLNGNPTQKSQADTLKDKITQKYERDIEEKTSELDNIKTTIEDHQSQILELTKVRLQLEKQIKSLSANKEKKIYKFLELTSNATKIDGIESIDMSDDFSSLIIYTSFIYIKSMGFRFHIGKFEIEVNMDNGSVSFLNLEPEHRRKSYWGDNCMHPHISKSGDACFGNVAESVMMAIKNMDIKSLCVILLNYLSSVNPADAAGAFLTNWDVVDENGIIVDFPVELTSCSHCGGRVTELNKENFHVCHDCDKNFCKDHIKQYTVYNEKSMQKDVFLCNLCRNEYFSCAECSHIVRNKYLCEVCGLFHCHDCVESATNQDGKAIHICKKCKEKMSNKKICQGKVLIKCSVCGHLHLIDIEQAPDYDSFICDNCKSNMCIFCHEEIHGQKIHISPTESLCVECWKKTDTCDVCGNRKLKEDLAYNDANNTKRCKNGCEV